MTSDTPARRFDGRWLLIAVLAIAALTVWGLWSGPLNRPRAGHDTWLGPLAPGLRVEPGNPSPPSPSHWMVPAGKETLVLELLAAEDGGRLKLADGIQIDRIAIERSTIGVHLGRGSDAGQLQPTGKLTIHHPSQSPANARKATHLAVSHTLELEGDQATTKALKQLEAIVLRRDSSSIFSEVTHPAAPARVNPFGALWTSRSSISSQLVYVLGLVALLAGLALASTFRTAGRIEVQALGRITHLLPAALQVVIYSYWFLHWSDGRALILPILTQVFCAYLLDIALSILVLRQWTASFGVVPIVLSTHLLAQFQLDAWWAGMFAVGVGLTVKTTVRRNGRPLFNPSVVGLSAIGLIDLFWKGLSTPDYSHIFAAPPNMTELIVLLALVVQFRLRIVLITLSAALTLMLFSKLTPAPSFGVAWAPATLVLCLLITDPATTPRTPGGQVLFGAFIGAGMVAIQALLTSLGHTDFWAKVLAIPAANLLVPSFDRWGKRLSNISLLSPQKNTLHVAAWVLTAALGLSHKGSGLDEEGGDKSIHSPCWTPAKLGNRCATNPTFCKPLSVVGEVGCWADR